MHGLLQYDIYRYRKEQIMSEKLQQVDWAKVVHDKMRFILAAAFVCALAAFLASFVLPKTYGSGLVLKVGKVSYATSKNGAEREDVTTDPLEPVRAVKDLIESEPFMAEVIGSLKLDTTPAKLLKKVKVKMNTETVGIEENRQLVITGKADTPQGAARLVNAIAEIVMARHKILFDQAMEVQHGYEGDLDAKMKLLSEELATMKVTYKKMEKDPKVDAPAVILLQAGIEEREANLINLARERSLARAIGHTGVKSEGTTIAQPAYIPAKALSPQPLTNLIVGFLVGAVVAGAYAFYKASLEARGPLER